MTALLKNKQKNKPGENLILRKIYATFADAGELVGGLSSVFLWVKT